MRSTDATRSPPAERVFHLAPHGGVPGPGLPGTPAARDRDPAVRHPLWESDEIAVVAGHVTRPTGRRHGGTVRCGDRAVRRQTCTALFVRLRFGPRRVVACRASTPGDPPRPASAFAAGSSRRPEAIRRFAPISRKTSSGCVGILRSATSGSSGGRHLYFEDIHICQQKGVCELGPELQRVTRFPVYFNQRRIYHVPHLTYYYQLLDEEFTAGLLAHPANDPVLEAHRTAIGRLRACEFTLQQALDYTRQNAEGTGTQNLNYRLHMRGMAEADTP